MMVIAIDFGNTRTKIGVFYQQKLVFQDAFDNVATVKDFEKIFLLFADINVVIISSVINISAAVQKYFQSKKIKITYLSNQTKLPIKNKYKTPETLGNDRLAVSCGAVSIFKNTNILVINCGTCITYDFINNKHEYLGGNISLGIDMRLNALHHFTKKLPLIKKNNALTLIGSNTETCINTGVINGAIAEIEGIIKNYKKQYSSLKIVVTGGDADFLAMHIKYRIFVVHHLTLIGLNSIINHP
jgi:type III pantothenate kinase